jgi:hypothetical protein
LRLCGFKSHLPHYKKEPLILSEVPFYSTEA